MHISSMPHLEARIAESPRQIEAIQPSIFAHLHAHGLEPLPLHWVAGPMLAGQLCVWAGTIFTVARLLWKLDAQCCEEGLSDMRCCKKNK